MGEITTSSTDLVHLVRLALAGRDQDVRTFAVRLSRKLRKSYPDVSAELAKLIGDNPSRQMPTRSSTLAALPVDADTRLQLARFDHSPTVDHVPVWADSVAEQLEQLIAEHRRGEDLLLAGLLPTRTAILTGPPGVGKTLAATWVASQLGRPLITLDLAAAISSFLGRTGANVKNVLEYAKGVECVLLLDEIDALAKRRDDAHEVGELKRLVTVLLQEVDDWPAGGLLVAATNHPELLDPAIWRRFEVRVEFPPPDIANTRLAVLTFLGTDHTIPDVWVDVLTQIHAGKSFSDIEREMLTARRKALMSGRPLEEVLRNAATRHVARLNKGALKKLSVCLKSAGVSQHEISRLTGLSRDTIRAASAEYPPPEN